MFALKNPPKDRYQHKEGHTHLLKNMFFVPLLVLQRLDFTGHVFSFIPGDVFSNGSCWFNPLGFAGTEMGAVS